jgi:hypothetical protein
MPSYGSADYLALGDNNAVCFQCGRKRKASELRKHWQGYYVCPEHWEARHPQDFVRATPDNKPPPWVQPPPAPDYVMWCTIPGSSAVVGYAVAGCSVSGRYVPNLWEYPPSILMGVPPPPPAPVPPPPPVPVHLVPVPPVPVPPLPPVPVPPVPVPPVPVPPVPVPPAPVPPVPVPPVPVPPPEDSMSAVCGIAICGLAVCGHP